MTNVIRPTFGARPRPEPATLEKAVDRPLRVIGEAAGYVVAVLDDPEAPEGAVLKVVVGPRAGTDLEPVAVLPRTPAGEIDADLVAMAVLRALAMTE